MQRDFCQDDALHSAEPELPLLFLKEGQIEGCFFFFILTHLVNGVLLGEVPEPFTQDSRTRGDFIYSCHSKGRRASQQANINVEV